VCEAMGPSLVGGVRGVERREMKRGRLFGVAVVANAPAEGEWVGGVVLLGVHGARGSPCRWVWVRDRVV